MARWTPLVLALMACGADPDKKRQDLTCDGEGPELVLVARAITFARIDGQISDGFDLDGGDSGAGCGVDDFTDPAGVPGIDNALAMLLPLIESTEGAAIEPLLQDSVNGGSLLVMFGLSDLDSLEDDTCVEVELFKGKGIPMIGNDGWLLPNQTLDRNPDTPVTAAPVASLHEGRLDVGPIDSFPLTLLILDLNATLVLSHVQIRLEPQPDGSWTGLLAGGVPLQDIIDTITLQNVDDAVYDLLGPALDLVADLDPDANGQCQQLSMTLRFEAVPAFLYE